MRASGDGYSLQIQKKKKDVSKQESDIAKVIRLARAAELSKLFKLKLQGKGVAIPRRKRWQWWTCQCLRSRRIMVGWTRLLKVWRRISKKVDSGVACKTADGVEKDLKKANSGGGIKAASGEDKDLKKHDAGRVGK